MALVGVLVLTASLAQPSHAAEARVSLAVKLAPGASLPASRSYLAEGNAVTNESLAKLGWTTVQVDQSAVGSVKAELLGSGVATAVEATGKRRYDLTPNDPMFIYQGEHTQTGTTTAWNTTTGSPGVTIAMIDSGFTPDADIADRMLPGINAFNGTSDLVDFVGHGTKTTHVAAAKGNDGFGMAGVCWSCKILPIKVDDGTGVPDEMAIATGIVYATDHGASVINISIGSPIYSPVEAAAVGYALSHQVTIVASAGNSGTTGVHFPAGYTGVISVAGVDPSDNIHRGSTFGSWTTVSAPFCMTYASNGEFGCGTSFSSPYTAAAIALRKATGQFPGETVDVTRMALMESAHRTNQPGFTASGRVQVDDLIKWGKAPVAPSNPGPPAAVSGTRYVPLTPGRVLDTRTGQGAAHQKLGPQQSLYLKVAGTGGVPATGVTSVVLNVTATGGTSGSFLSVYPHGVPWPGTSSLNFSGGQDLPNLITTRISADGYAVVYNASGWVDVVADVQGYFDSAGAGTGPSYVNPVTPARILDTRTGDGAPLAKIGSNSSINLQVTGRGGVPATEVTGVILNVTAANPTQASYATVWPTGAARPLASNLNYSWAVRPRTS